MKILSSTGATGPADDAVPGVAPAPKSTVTSGELDRALSKTYRPKEIHINKDSFKDLVKTPHGASSGPNTPVEEKALGSTKQLGTYRAMPVYSHGREKDHVYIQGEGDSKGWFKNGEPTTKPPGQAPIDKAANTKPVILS